MATEPSGHQSLSPHPVRLPWHLFPHAVRSAFDYRKLLLAALGLIFLRAGWGLLDRSFPDSRAVTASLLETDPGETGGWFTAAGVPVWEALRMAAWRVIEPARALAVPLLSLFRPGMGTVWLVHALLALFWALAVWGLAGGAICRLAAVEVSGKPKPGPLTALRFAIRYGWALLATPLWPLLVLGMCTILCAGFGLLFRLPGLLGRAVGGSLFFVPLMLALLMVVLLLCLSAGWPLMIASIATEADDMLDALSRSLGYLGQRPVKSTGYAAVAWLLGIPGALVAFLLAAGVLYLAGWGAGLSAPEGSLAGLADGVWQPPMAGAGWSLPLFWKSVVGLFVRSWVYAYFWTAATSIYLLLRQEVDGTSWTEVNVPSSDLPANSSPMDEKGTA